MKTMNYFKALSCAVLAVAAFASCDKELASNRIKQNPVTLSFSTNSPEFDSAEGKVDLADEGGFTWDGTETASILIGTEETTSKATGLQREISTGSKPGVFSAQLILASLALTI